MYPIGYWNEKNQKERDESYKFAFIFRNMMEHTEQTTTTVSSSKSKLFVIITLSTAVSLIIIIAIFLLATNKQSPTQIAIAQSLKSVSKQSTTCM